MIGDMPDPKWFADSRLPPPPRQSKPGERVWTLGKNGRQIDCELRSLGESYGWECQCLLDGELAYGQRFGRRQDATSEAEAQRIRLLSAGWTCEVSA
jgi:hypothetical protein